jgi:uncharacterized protein YxeA
MRRCKRGKNMNKNVTILAVLFMIFVGFQLAGPAAATNVVDHGTRYVGPTDHYKIVWKTYQDNNNFLKMVSTAYYKNPFTKKYELNFNSVTALTKVTMTSIKIKETRKQFVNPFDVHYAKTKLTAA